MPGGSSVNEGFVGTPKRQKSTQPSGGSVNMTDGSFGKHGGKGSTVDGVKYEGGAEMAARNVGGNYAEVGSSARRFGTGGAMKS